MRGDAWSRAAPRAFSDRGVTRGGRLLLFLPRPSGGSEQQSGGRDRAAAVDQRSDPAPFDLGGGGSARRSAAVAPLGGEAIGPGSGRPRKADRGEGRARGVFGGDQDASEDELSAERQQHR